MPVTVDIPAMPRDAFAALPRWSYDETMFLVSALRAQMGEPDLPIGRNPENPEIGELYLGFIYGPDFWTVVRIGEGDYCVGLCDEYNEGPTLGNHSACSYVLFPSDYPLLQLDQPWRSDAECWPKPPPLLLPGLAAARDFEL